MREDSDSITLDSQRDNKPQTHFFNMESTAWPTLSLFVVFFAGVPANFYLVATHQISLMGGILLGILLYNCAFTIWHEAAHENIFKKQLLNDIIGFFTFIINIFPGNFYTQKHDHLLHHRYLLDITYDRTVYRARGPYWRLILGMLDEMRTYGLYFKNHGLKTKWKLNVDHAIQAIVLTISAVLIAHNQSQTFFFCCLLPRLIVLPIHLTYVCYFPHVGLPKNQILGTRTLNISFFKYFIFLHNYHAVHHLWPRIPWYLYEKYFYLNLPVIKEYGVETLVKPWNAPIFSKKSWMTGSDEIENKA